MLGAPARGGTSARCTRPQAHRTSCRSYWVVCACASGRSVTWWEYRTPRSAAPARSAPHPQLPSGSTSSVSSGCSRQARYAPGAPGCLPGLRPPPRRAVRSGGFFPGRSSVPGGIDEFPLLREISRSSRATRSASSAFCVFSAAICASLSSSSIRSRAFSARSVTASPGASLGHIGHTGTTSEPALRNQHDTLSRPAKLPKSSRTPAPARDLGPPRRSGLRLPLERRDL